MSSDFIAWPGLSRFREWQRGIVFSANKYTRLLWAGCLLALNLAVSAPAQDGPVVEIRGSLVVDKALAWSAAHYKVHGDIVFKPGGVLRARDCTIEQMNTYSRQFKYLWEGGRLETVNTTIGGSMVGGLIYQSNFELHAGEWESTDTTVRYTYGIVFGYGPQGGRLRATRLKQGPNPDSIIMSGRGDAVLRDSTYNVSLNMYLAQSKGNGDFAMPIGVPLHAVFDGRNVPGAEYRLELINTAVPLWWIFANQVQMAGPPREVVLRDCPKFIPSILAHDLRGELRLPCAAGGGRPMGPHSALKTGNLTWRTLDKPATLCCWGLYLTGEKTDVTVRGATVLCELMLFDGRAAVIGDEGKSNTFATGTTIDVGRPGQKTTARLHFKNSSLGLFQDRGESAKLLGQATAQDGAEIVIDSCRLRRMQLITQGSGRIDVRDSTRQDVRTRQEGGPIRIVRGEETP
jgi:hypothetical protein